jgi:hypothetical protein
MTVLLPLLISLMHATCCVHLILVDLNTLIAAGGAKIHIHTRTHKHTHTQGILFPSKTRT